MTDLSQDEVVALQLEDLANRVLADASTDNVSNSQNWLLEHGHHAGYGTNSAATRALAEAWGWLRSRGLVERDPVSPPTPSSSPAEGMRCLPRGRCGGVHRHVGRRRHGREGEIAFRLRPGCPLHDGAPDRERRHRLMPNIPSSPAAATLQPIQQLVVEDEDVALVHGYERTSDCPIAVWQIDGSMDRNQPSCALEQELGEFDGRP